jgi:lipopolysaccharide/colanic/teichoic acid biosynthesis glycosyltransferase
MHIGNEKICDYWYNTQKREVAKTKSAFIKITDDPRITKVGKFIRNTSIDELPQLINVIKGDMSIVGNRPLPVYEAELLTRGFASKRFLAPAGITGLWQVELRGKGGVMSEEERMRLDNEYADHFIGNSYSFWYDLKLILRTVPALFQKDTV